MIPNAMGSDAAALVYTNIGTMGQTRSTRAISEKRTGSSFSKSEVHNMLEPYSGRQDEPESVFFIVHGGIDATGNCVFPIIREQV